MGLVLFVTITLTGCLILVTVRKEALLSIALVILVIIPPGFVSALPNGLTLATIPVMFWAGRTLVERVNSSRDISNAYPLMGQFERWALLSLFFACIISLTFSNNALLGAVWTINFALNFILILLLGPTAADVRTLHKTLLVVGVAVAIYCLYEVLTSSNPLYSGFYESVAGSRWQHWSVYRAQASLGHPLYAGAFLASCAVLALGSWLKDGGRARALATIVTTAGLLATYSRGPLLALCVGGAITCLVECRRDRVTRTRVVGAAVLIVTAAIIASASGLLSERGDSSEAASSTADRLLALELAQIAARDASLFGAGPGSSHSALEPFNFTGILVESSLIQLFLSIGIIGVSLFIATVSARVGSALFKHPREVTAPIAGSVGALAAYVVAISGYNAIDGVFGSHLMLGLFAVVAASVAAAGTEEVPGSSVPALSKYRENEPLCGSDSRSARSTVQ